jgi:spiro-SPASM protein
MNYMENIAFVNAISLSPYAFQSLPGIRSSFEAAVNAAHKLPGVARVVIAVGPDGAGDEFKRIAHDCEVQILPDKSLTSLLRLLDGTCRGECDIFYLYGDCPLIDEELAARMHENHRRYFSEYTFADGYPSGLSAEILSSRVVKRLIALSEQYPSEVRRDSLFGLIQKDINSFDLETEISPVDLRMLRVSLSADSKRNHLLLSRIIEAGGHDSASVIDIIQTRPQILRTLPAFASIQITDGCPQACTYCPYPLTHDVLSSRDEMSLSDYRTILSKLKEFADDCTVSVSLWGEPSLHSDIRGIVAETTSIEGFSLIIETSGIGWTDEVLDAVLEASSGRVDWILSLDAHERQLYRSLRGQGFDEAFAFFDRVHSRFPSEVWVQAVRMKESEEKLEAFYRFFKEKIGDASKVIIQKYDSFCGLLPERKVTDLSPLMRFPCWHLKRDLSVLLDGTVILCREDIRKDHVLGNILSRPIDEIWRKGDEFYAAHIEKSYHELCRTCDEYYTFNF